MKKLLAVLMVIVSLMNCAYALGEVVVLESPDDTPPDYSGTLEDLKVGIGVDLGDRIYMPVKIEIADQFYTYQKQDYYAAKSGVENQYVCLWMEVFNYDTKDVIYFNDASVVLVYENERGTYKFAGFVRQCPGDEEYSACYTEKDFQPVGQLKKRMYLFGCAVPNFVEENPGKISMEITTAGKTMNCVIRE